jgi:hypothetical protein
MIYCRMSQQCPKAGKEKGLHGYKPLICLVELRGVEPLTS